MKFFKKEKGFTLIELLVVVAIIGILSTIVLSSLSKARKRAEYAKIQTELKQLQNQAEIYALDNGSYSSGLVNYTCPSAVSNTPTNLFESELFFNKIQRIKEIAGVTSNDAAEISCLTSASGDKYVFIIRIDKFATLFGYNPTGDMVNICIDSMGNLSRVYEGQAEESMNTSSGNPDAPSCLPDETII